MMPRQGAQITKASHFDYEYVLGHKIVFLCVAKGKPRPTIVWYKDGRELFNHHYLHVSLTQSLRQTSRAKYHHPAHSRSVNIGEENIGSSPRWRSTQQLRGTPGSTSVTLTTSK